MHFAGYRRGRELAACYASADIFVFPSDTETFGQAVTEALSSGLPVVAPNRGGVTGTVLPGETGLLFEPGDLPKLVDRVLTLIRDPALRERLGAEGRRRAEARSWTRIFRQLFQDYHEAVGMRNAPVRSSPPARSPH